MIKGELHMTYEEIVAQAKEIAEKKDASSYKGHLAVQINIEGEGSGIYYVEIRDGKVDVQPYDYLDRDCILIATADFLTKILEGSMDAVGAFLSGKLKVEGSVDKALEFQKLLNSPDKK